VVSIALSLPLCSESDLSIGLVGLSLGPQDPRGPPANCGTYRVKNKKIKVLVTTNNVTLILSLSSTVVLFIGGGIGGAT